MKISTTFTIVLNFIISIGISHAQNETNNWYFGNYNALNFSNQTPSELLDCAMETIEGCASMSDNNGNLLFYSNGEKVWNKHHMVMPNGDSIAGNTSTTQAALFVPKPGDPNVYYLFTPTQQFAPSTHSFYYSIVDLSLDSGRGDLTVKNQFIKSPIAEKLAGTKHANGTDYWIVVHGYGNDSLFAYLLTSSGLSQSPVVSKFGQSIVGVSSLGYMKFSADGSKIAYACRFDNFVELYDFDNSTGNITNNVYLTLPPPPLIWNNGFGAYGLEFSISGNYLYAIEMRHDSIFQWDITSNNSTIINSTRKSVGSFPPATHNGAMQMARNGKIYIAKGFSNVLGVINNPELPGVSCNFSDTGFVMSSSITFGFPNFISSSFISVGIDEFPDKGNFSVYPNPFINNISLVYDFPINEKGLVLIYNTFGQVVHSTSINNLIAHESSQLNLDFLPNGVYLLTISFKNRSFSKFIVKQ